MTGLAVLLAAAGACCFAVAAWLQQAAVHTATAGGALRRAGWARMLRAPRWVGGCGLTAAGAALHVGALSLAPLVVVQPVGVLAIALAAVLAARSHRVRLAGPARWAVAASTVGVGLFVVLAAAKATAAPPAVGAEVRSVLLAGIAVAVFGTVGALARGSTRCVAFAAAAGTAFGLVSVLTRTMAARVEAGGLDRLSLVSVAVVGAAAVVGGWCVQHAYASGPPQVVVACQTVVDPMLAVGIGVGFLGEGAHVSAPAAIGLGAGAVLAVAGVIALARRQVSRSDSFVPAKEQSLMTSTRPSPPVCTAPAEPSAPPVPPRLRIVLGADTFPPDINGASHFAARLASGLAGRGHEVHVLCPAAGACSATETTADGVTVHRVASRRTLFHPTFRICPPWRASAAASALLEQLAPDVVHVQSHFLIGRALARAAAQRPVALVATNHFMPENLFGHARIPTWLQAGAARLAWRDLRRVFGAAQAVTAPTPRAVQLLADAGLPEATAISCGIDLHRYGARPTRRPGDPEADRPRRVLFVGRLDEEKRVDELLRAAALLPAALDVRWEIIGDGSCRRTWQDLAAELGIAERVRFYGFVDEDTLLDAYRRCDVFCMPGVAELQSLATMEAMAAGAAIVAADAMALPHLVHPGRNGRLYPPGDVPALAACLTDLLTDPATLTRLGEASRRIVADHALDRTLDAFESLYRHHSHQHPAPAARGGAQSPEPAIGVPR
ncbi:glycosyltransferase [Nocardia sp. GAS34]|uniref:glycosyltransferase n=1 Tax=unclassified Nocardia TaxID=2637762 RepID=UPI003D237DCB